MFYLLFDVRPQPEWPHTAAYGGSFVNCWINTACMEEAETVARKVIEAQGWVVHSLEEAFPVTREWYLALPESLRYFEEAEEEGACYVFHTWPADAIE